MKPLFNAPFSVMGKVRQRMMKEGCTNYCTPPFKTTPWGCTHRLRELISRRQLCLREMNLTAPFLRSRVRASAQK